MMHRSVRQTAPSAPWLPIFIIAVFGGPALHAQQPRRHADGQRGRRRRPRCRKRPRADAVRLLVGRSTLLDIGTPIARVSLTSADIADAMVTSPNQLLVHGKVPGTISMFVWSRGGARAPLRDRRCSATSTG